MKPAAETRRLVQLAQDLGLETQVKKSNASNSHYVTLVHPRNRASLRIRISNHARCGPSPNTVDLEIGNHRQATAPHTMTPYVITRISQVSGLPNKADRLLREWNSQAIDQARREYEATARREGLEYAAQANALEEIRQGGTFSDEKLSRITAKHLQLAGASANKQAVARVQNEIKAGLKLDPGSAILVKARKQQGHPLPATPTEKVPFLAKAKRALRPIIQTSRTPDQAIAASLQTARSTPHGLEALSLSLSNKFHIPRSEASKAVKRHIKQQEKLCRSTTRKA